MLAQVPCGARAKGFGCKSHGKPAVSSQQVQLFKDGTGAEMTSSK